MSQRQQNEINELRAKLDALSASFEELRRYVKRLTEQPKEHPEVICMQLLITTNRYTSYSAIHMIKRLVLGVLL